MNDIRKEESRGSRKIWKKSTNKSDRFFKEGDLFLQQASRS